MHTVLYSTIYLLLISFASTGFAQNRDLHDVINRLKADLATASDSSASYARMGLLYLRLEEADSAEAAFQNALALRPNLAIAHTGLGRVYQNLRNKPDRALSHYEKAVAIDTTDADAHDRLIKTLLALEDMGSRARKAASQTIARFPDRASPYLLLARAHREEGSAHQVALYYYKKYLERNPEDHETAYQFAYALYEAKEYRDLEDITSRMRDPRALPLLAQALIKRRDHEGALAAFHAISRPCPKKNSPSMTTSLISAQKPKRALTASRQPQTTKHNASVFSHASGCKKIPLKPREAHCADPNTTAGYGMREPTLAKSGRGIAEEKYTSDTANPTISQPPENSMPLSHWTYSAFKNKERTHFTAMRALRPTLSVPSIRFAPWSKVA